MRSSFLLVALGLAACTRQPAEGLPPGVEIEDLPESEGWDVDFRTSAAGRPQLQVQTPYLARYAQDTAHVYLGPPTGGPSATPVSLRLFDDRGAARGSVRAPEVWLYDADGRVVAQGGVRATVADGGEVEAQRMTLVGQRIDARGRVRAVAPGEGGAQVQAARLTMEDGRIEAAGNVRASVTSGGGAQIEAAQLVTSPGGAFTASGGARVQIQGRAQATVRARTVSGSGGRYVAQGGVRVETSGGRTLEAGRVVWDEAAGRFSAPGAFSFDGPGARIRGVGLSATSDLSRYTFRRATGQIEVAE